MWHSATQGTLSWLLRRGNGKFALCGTVACFNRFLLWNPTPGKMDIACVLQSIIMAIMKIQRICLINQKSKLCLLVCILQSLQVNIYRLISTITIHYLVAGEKTSCFSLELKDATSFDHTSKLNQGHLGDCGKYSTPLKKK